MSPGAAPAPVPNYINAAVSGFTSLSPSELLIFTQAIENKLGRVRSIPCAPRTLDIDILLYDDAVIDTPDLTIGSEDHTYKATDEETILFFKRGETELTVDMALAAALPVDVKATVEIDETSSTLLASRWCLHLEDATPGSRRFSITLGRPGDQCILNVFLDEEVPSS